MARNETGISSRIRQCVIACGLTALAIGLFWLAAWLTGDAVLWAERGALTVKANMAVSQILAAVSLLLLGTGPAGSTRRALGRSAAVVVFLIGSLTLSEHLAGCNLHIDEFLFSESPGAAGTASPNRMGPYGSMSLFLAGAGLLCLKTRRQALASYSGLLMCGLNLVPAVGFLYRIQGLVARPQTGISWPTVVAMMALGSGLVFAYRDSSFVGLLLREDAGGALFRRLLPAVLLLPVFTGFLRVWGERQGFYDTATGTGIHVIFIVLVFSALLWHNAAHLGRSTASQRRAEEALLESEVKFRVAFANAAIGLAIAEPDGRFIDANPAYCELLGYDLQELRSLSLPHMIHNADQAANRQLLDSMLSGEAGHFVIENRYVRKSGQIIWVRKSVSLVRDAAGAPRWIISLIENITERKQAEEAQRALLEERSALLESERIARTDAERASRIKDEFLANLSHELRTPLNAILGWAQILRKGNADASSVKKGLEVIERNTRIQVQLISDLLDMSRIVAGKMRLETERCDPVLALEAAIESAAPAAAAKKIRIEKLLMPIRSLVLGDPSRLQQVFWNLLSNGLKFTPAGGKIEVEVSLHDTRMEFVFRDSGQGIAPEFLPHIFERFRQADSGTSKSNPGLGLGLAIVRHLVELHGGTVAADSAGEGKGTAFTIVLPVSTDAGNARESAEVAAEVLQPGAIVLNGIKVLFVDDEPDSHEMVRRLLEPYGATVLVAGDAAAAIALLQDQRPDVLIGDIGMPGVDGYQMIRNIRGLPREAGGRIPAIALTAYSRVEDRTRAMLAGYEYHMTKPVNASELIATLGMITQRLPRSEERSASASGTRNGAALS
jgi:PAS domain S-box-containing protein